MSDIQYDVESDEALESALDYFDLILIISNVCYEMVALTNGKIIDSVAGVARALMHCRGQLAS